MLSKKQRCPLPELPREGGTVIPQKVEERRAFILLHPGQIQLFIRTIEDKPPITIIVPADSEVRTIKEEIEKQLKVPVPEQRLLYSGNQLEDKRSLQEYDIQTESALLLSKLSS